MSISPVIEVEKATKTFAGDRATVQALDRFDLTVDEGQFVSIVGPSGCGKNTLLWAMAALWPLTSGSMTIYGQKVRTPRREVGMVFQEANLRPGGTCLKTSISRSKSCAKTPNSIETASTNSSP